MSALPITLKVQQSLSGIDIDLSAQICCIRVLLPNIKQLIALSWHLHYFLMELEVCWPEKGHVDTLGWWGERARRFAAVTKWSHSHFWEEICSNVCFRFFFFSSTKPIECFQPIKRSHAESNPEWSEWWGVLGSGSRFLLIHLHVL